MRRAYGKVIVLALTAAALAWLALFGPRSLNEASSEKLTALTPADVTRIRLVRPGRDVVELQRQGNTWMLTNPIRTRANPVRALALASLAGATSNVVYDTSQASADTLGLGASALVLELNDVALRIGTREEVRGLRYVQNANQVFLLQDRFYHHVSATSAGFVDPALFDPARRITTIVTPAIELHAGETGVTWQPGDAFASADTAAAWLQTWRTLSALTVSFTDYSATWQPAATVHFASGDTERLVFRTQQNRVWLARPEADLQYEIPVSRAQTLGLTPP